MAKVVPERKISRTSLDPFTDRLYSGVVVFSKSWKEDLVNQETLFPMICENPDPCTHAYLPLLPPPVLPSYYCHFKIASLNFVSHSVWCVRSVALLQERAHRRVMPPCSPKAPFRPDRPLSRREHLSYGRLRPQLHFLVYRERNTGDHSFHDSRRGGAIHFRCVVWWFTGK